MGKGEFLTAEQRRKLSKDWKDWDSLGNSRVKFNEPLPYVPPRGSRPVAKYPEPVWLTVGEDIEFGTLHCFLCDCPPVQGELVLVRNEVVADKLGWGAGNVRWYVQHELCLRAALENVPEESFTAIKARLAQGGDLFIEEG